MKKWMKIALWSLFVIGIVVLLSFVRQSIREKVVLDPEIHITVDGENAFLTEIEVLTRLKQANLLFVGQKFEELEFEKIERYIGAMPEVKTVRAYSQFSGQWKLDIELRMPIARVFNNFGENFYLDKDGFSMETTTAHTARVLVVTGDIPDKFPSLSVDEIINNDSLKSIRKIDDVYRISNYVCNDPLMQALIGQIHRKRNGDFVLIPIIGGQEIIFGSALSTEEVEEKFKKLKIFYKEAMPYQGWNKYSEISLKYKEQIVCRKKE